MTRPEAVWFDADGVLTLPEDFFSVMYAKSRGLDPESLGSFFRGDFSKAMIGKADLKELVRHHNDVWKWEGDVDELLKLWFSSEDVRNQPLIDLISGLRRSNVLCFLATNQEKYRAAYMKKVMFPGLFDGHFISSELGAQKPEPEYFLRAKNKMKNEHPTINLHETYFFDDRQENVDAASKVGLRAFLYESVEQVKTVLSLE